MLLRLDYGTSCLPIEISPSGYILLNLIHASQFHHEFLQHAWACIKVFWKDTDVC